MSAPKHRSIYMMFDVQWDCSPLQFQGPLHDTRITREVSTWIDDLTIANVDGLKMVEREWDILHIEPGGHLKVFVRVVHLDVQDTMGRIQYPFVEPGKLASPTVGNWTVVGSTLSRILELANGEAGRAVIFDITIRHAS